MMWWLSCLRLFLSENFKWCKDCLDLVGTNLDAVEIESLLEMEEIENADV